MPCVIPVQEPSSPLSNPCHALHFSEQLSGLSFGLQFCRFLDCHVYAQSLVDASDCQWWSFWSNHASLSGCIPWPLLASILPGKTQQRCSLSISYQFLASFRTEIDCTESQVLHFVFSCHNVNWAYGSSSRIYTNWYWMYLEVNITPTSYSWHFLTSIPGWINQRLLANESNHCLEE